MSRNAAAMAKLASWAQRFERLASPQQKGALTRELSKETLNMIEEGFRKESTPTGQKWRPKKRPNGKQILVDGGRMRSGFSATVGLNRWSIRNTQAYTGVHQHGSRVRNIPRRQMWPSADKLPASWIRSYSKIFSRRTWAVLKGKR